MNMLKDNEQNENEIKNNLYIVYMHVNKVNKKKYIGLTRRNPHDRWMSNGLGYKGQGFYNAIKKYGWDNFDHIIIANNLNFNDASKLEMDLIKHFDTTHYGYNQSSGGEGSQYYYVSKDVRKKISNTMIQNGCHRGSKNSQFGVSPKDRMNKETYNQWKSKIKQTTLSIKEKTRKPIICINTGEIYSCAKEVEEKFGLGSSAIKNNCYMHLHSDLYDVNGRYYYWDYYDENHKFILEDYIKKYAKRPIICLEDKIIFTNSSEVSRVNGGDCSHILKCCKNQNKSCCGKHYMFYKDYLDKYGLNVTDDESDAICIGDAVLEMLC